MNLQTYTGEPIDVCGATQVQVKHNEQTLTLPLLVTKGDGPTLLGWNSLEALRLDWLTIFHVGANGTLQQVLDQHRDVFKEELGELRGTAAKIHLERDAQPRFEKACPVPFTICKKVEQTSSHPSSPVFRLDCANCTSHEARWKSEDMRGL